MNKGALFILKNEDKELRILVVHQLINRMKYRHIDFDCQIKDFSDKASKLISKQIGSEINLDFLGESGVWRINKKYYYTNDFSNQYDITNLDSFINSIVEIYNKEHFLDNEIIERIKNHNLNDPLFWNHKKLNNEIVEEIIIKYWGLDPINNYPDFEPYNTLLKLADKRIHYLNSDFILKFWNQFPTRIKKKITEEIRSKNIFIKEEVFTSDDFWLDKSLTENIAKDMLLLYYDQKYSIKNYTTVEPYRSFLKLFGGKAKVITNEILDSYNKASEIIKVFLDMTFEKNKYEFENFEVFVKFFSIINSNSILNKVYKLIEELADKFNSYNNHVEKEKLFVDFHTKLINYFKKLALKEDKKIDMRPIIPGCTERYNLIHCEGNTYTKHGYNYWCRNKPCIRKVITKNMTLNEKNWSLLEIFNYYSIDIDFNNSHLWQMKHFNSLNDYVRKIGGALNRLNEIRERLKCRSCGEVMSFDWKYPIQNAAYKETVVECENKKCYEQGNKIYLNHCWACGNIIDGRDNTITVDGYKLCLTCGSGPQKSREYSQGDVCPQCGSRNIESINNDKHYTCNNCEHSIKIPSPKKITGLN